MMEIKILNYDIDKEINVDFQVFFIHGSILENQENEIAKTNQIICTVNNTQKSKWLIIDGSLKCFCNLQHGVNKIELTANDSMICFQVKYYVPQFKRYILPVYVICKNSDGSFISPPEQNNDLQTALKKFKFNFKLMQTFMAESLYEHGYDRKTFHFKQDDTGDPKILVFHSNLDIEDSKSMKENELYSQFHKELIEDLGEDKKRKMFVLMSCTRYNPENYDESKTSRFYVTGHGALGGGDMALFSTGSLHTWAENFEELYKRFTDDRKIDERFLFDDSCNRKLYWANYSTTLGASIHEIGHCLDLCHTPNGIMARGHDDMDCFFTVRKKDDLFNIIEKDSSNQYKGAHWYRSSAVILNSHKWLNHKADVIKKVTTKSEKLFTISLHPDFLGPVGNAISLLNLNQETFSLREWLKKNELKFAGVKIWYSEYVNALQFYGYKLSAKDKNNACTDLVASPTNSLKSEEGKTFELFLSNDEVLEKIRVRSGEWIDSLQFFTQHRSTMQLGGNGGRIQDFIVPNDKEIDDWIITYGSFLGSIKITLKPNQSSRKPENEALTISSENGLILFETYKQNGEVNFYEEFENKSKVNISIEKILELEETMIKGCVYDCRGKKLPFSFSKSDLELVKNIISL